MTVNVTKAVDVWYVCDQVLCNFDCPYCSTQLARRAGGRRVWAAGDSADRYRAVLGWLAGLPWRLRVRLQTLGEPFASKEFLRGAAWLCAQSNIDFVELVTNGSFTSRQFRGWAATCSMDRISLWITYHHTEIAAETLVTNARMAQDVGAFVVVHALVFPDNLQAIEHLVELCKEAGLRTDVTIGHNFNGAYPRNGLLAILETEPRVLVSMYRHTAALRTMVTAHRGPKGEPCSAGHDYIRIYPDGGVYPCAPYRGLPSKQIGSALDPDFVPVLRAEAYAPCEADGLCGCKEDYLHLRTARSVLRFPKSLGYYEPAVD
jgi:MoaA/NifB/PqqE/SkfB family radical SAM enzyme